ncbi:MAG: hypothetical protein RMJ55_07670 [Roseiflexaceae bacterium]|nr:hypothetical protein [Roseiflexaceae bacterium]
MTLACVALAPFWMVRRRVWRDGHVAQEKRQIGNSGSSTTHRNILPFTLMRCTSARCSE